MNDRIVHILHFYADSLSHPQFMNDWSFISCKDAMEGGKGMRMQRAFCITIVEPVGSSG